jgi:hypothetical protein
MNDFDGGGTAPLYLGEITGIRAFKVLPDTKVSRYLGLTQVLSPSQPHVWADGVNTGKCFRPFQYPNEKTHKIAQRDCRCGFYAYFDSAHAYAFWPAGYPGVLGIVRGSGRVTYGRDGFRAEKMRIVAFVDEYQSAVDRVGTPPPDAPSLSWRRKFLGAVIGLFALDVLLIILGFIVGGDLGMVFTTMSYIACAAIWVAWTAWIRRRRKFDSEMLAWQSDFMKWSRAQSARLRRNNNNILIEMGIGGGPLADPQIAEIKRLFPDVPWYTTVEAAEADFPLSSVDDFNTDEATSTD